MEVVMYLRTLLIIVVIGLLAVFALLNWSVFLAQTTLSVGFTTVEAPLGLILLSVTGVLTLLFLIYVVYLQSSALVESRRFSRELQAQREIADHAEASRFNQLQSFLTAEMGQLAQQTLESKTATLAKLDEVERDLRTAIEQSANTLAAYLGEIEDRFDRFRGDKT
jgi:Na+-transporting methylmalonyl-CoA/oxaloacetate decarboxylase gamma subunit